MLVLDLYKKSFLSKGAEGYSVSSKHAVGRVRTKKGSESMWSHVKYTRITPSRCQGRAD